MTTEVVDIRFETSGDRAVKATLDSIAAGAEKGEASVDGLNSSLRQTSSAAASASGAGSLFSRAFSGLPSLMNRAFGTGLIKDFSNATRPLGGILSAVGSGLREGAKAGWEQSRSLSEAGRSVRAFGDGAGGAGPKLSNLGSQIRQVSGLVTSLGAALGGKIFLNLVEQVDEVNTALQGISQYGASVEQNFARLGEISSSTGTSMKANADALLILNQYLSEGQGRVVQYAGGMQALGAQSMTAEQIISGLGGVFLRGGQSAEQAAKATQAFTGALADGAVTLQSYTTLANNSRLLAAGIAAAWGGTSMQFSRAVADGKISAAQFMAYTQQAIDQINRFPPIQPSIAQSFEMLKQRMIEFVGTSKEAGFAANFISNGLLLIKDNIATIAPYVLATAAAFGALVAIQVGLWAIGVVTALAQMVLSLARATIGIIAQTAAMAIASPIGFAFAAAGIAAGIAWLAASGKLEVAVQTLKDLYDGAKKGIESAKKLGESLDKTGEGAKAAERAAANYNGVITEAKAKTEGLTGANKGLKSSFDGVKSSVDATAQSFNGLSNAYQAAATAADNAALSAGQHAAALADAAEKAAILTRNLREGEEANKQTYQDKSLRTLTGGNNGAQLIQIGGFKNDALKAYEALVKSQDAANRLLTSRDTILAEVAAGLRDKQQAAAAIMGLANAATQIASGSQIDNGATNKLGTETRNDLLNSLSGLKDAVNDNTKSTTSLDTTTKNLSQRLSPQGFDPTKMGRVFVPNASGFSQEGTAAPPAAAPPAPATYGTPYGPGYGQGGGNAVSDVRKGPVTQIINIQADNVDSYRRSRRQIAADTRRAIGR